MHSLGATDLPIPLPGKVEARPSLHHPKNNLGLKKEGGAGRVDQPSRRSLRASFRAQEQNKLLPESTPLWHLASEEGTGQTSLAESNLPLQQALGGETSQRHQEVPPPTQLWRFMLKLRHEMAKLYQVMGNLAVLLDSQLRTHSLDAELGDACAKHSDNKKKNNNNNDTHTTTTTTSPTTTTIPTTITTTTTTPTTKAVESLA